MKYEKFLTSLLTYKKLSETLSELHDIGFDFFEGKYAISSDLGILFTNTFEGIYDEEGLDWISWFIYEADWGTRDFGLTDDDGNPQWGASDENGNPIAFSFESLWELLENEYIVLEDAER